VQFSRERHAKEQKENDLEDGGENCMDRM